MAAAATLKVLYRCCCRFPCLLSTVQIKHRGSMPPKGEAHGQADC